MKVVLDTSVVVAGLDSDSGASRQVLLKVYDGSLVPLASTALFLEYENVLNRSAFLQRADLDHGDIRRFLAAFALMCKPVVIDVSWRPVARDPDDDRVLEAAVNGGANAIVTHNVRDLMPAERFGVAVLTPGKLLRRFLP